MSLALDHLLAPSQTEAMLAHLEECPQCEQVWQMLQRVSMTLESASRAAPAAEFTGRVMLRLLQYEIRRKRFWGVMRASFIWAVLWTSVLFTLGLILILSWRLGIVSAASLLSLISHLGDKIAIVFEVIRLLAKATLLVTAELWSGKVALLLGVYSLIAFGLVALWVRLVARYPGGLQIDRATD